MTKLPLQICTAVLALIPIVTGVVTLLGIKDPLYRPLGLPEAPILDSNLRVLRWHLARGRTGHALVGALDRSPGNSLSRTLDSGLSWGVGRLLSWMLVGAPPKPFVGFTLLELVGAPLFIYWQARVAQAVGGP
ncbi:MAG: DUF4345 family protein [Gemmatimonadales bacterium]